MSTEIAGTVEVVATGGTSDWVLLNPGTELYVVSEATFTRSYQLIGSEEPGGET